MDKDEFMIYAQSEIENLHNDPLLVGYFDEVKRCQTMLDIFQWLTIGIIVVLAIRFKTMDINAEWKVNKLILSISGILLAGMMIYEMLNYECMSSGTDGVPVGLQLMTLLVVGYFFFQKKEY